MILLTSCAFGASAERQQEDAVLREKLVDVQKAACLTAATTPTCTDVLRLSFELPPRGALEMWCGADGSAHVRGGEVDGPLPLAVWNAIERVVQASDGCINVYGGRVSIMWRGTAKTCADPRFDVHELFDLAYDVAKEGPTPTPRTLPRPTDKCPPFPGPLWTDRQ